MCSDRDTAAPERRPLRDLTSPREAFERAMASHSQELGRFFLAQLLGFEVSYDAELCVVEFEAKEFLHNPRGTLQGGVLATALDLAMGHLIQRWRGPAATIALDVRYHRPISSGRVRIVAQPVHRGARIWTLSASAQVGPLLLATATASFALLGNEPAGDDAS